MIEISTKPVSPRLLDGATVSVDASVYYTDDARFSWAVNVRSETRLLVCVGLCSTREEADQTAAVILDILHARTT